MEKRNQVISFCSTFRAAMKEEIRRQKLELIEMVEARINLVKKNNKRLRLLHEDIESLFDYMDKESARLCEEPVGDDKKKFEPIRTVVELSLEKFDEVIKKAQRLPPPANKSLPPLLLQTRDKLFSSLEPLLARDPTASTP